MKSEKYPPPLTQHHAINEAIKLLAVPSFHDRRVLLNHLIVSYHIRVLEDVLEMYGEAGLFHPQMRDEDPDAYLAHVTGF